MNPRLVVFMVVFAVPFWALVIVGALYLLGVLT